MCYVEDDLEVVLPELGDIGGAQHAVGPGAAPISPPASTMCCGCTLWWQVEQLELQLDPTYGQMQIQVLHLPSKCALSAVQHQLHLAGTT